jgi:ADP-heptose:LPS heptosyltransferase
LILNKDKIKKILVIKFGGVGDVLNSTPLLPNLREYFPSAVINFLTYKKCIDAVKNNPYITRALAYTINEDGSYCFLKNIRKQKYDLIIDLFGNPRTAFATFYSDAKYKAGYKFRLRSYAYNFKIAGRGSEVHNVEFNLDALKRLNIPINSKKLFISTNEFYEDIADKFIKENNIDSKKIMGIAISGGWDTKKYKLVDYIILIKKIFKKYDLNIIFLWGTDEERNESEFIKFDFSKNVFITPKTNLEQLSAIMKRCDFILGNDSGMLHLAVASGVPVLGIYGPTNPHLQGPYGENNVTVVNDNLDCLNCNLLDCPIGNICMTELSKDLIMEKIEELLQKIKRA